MNAKYLKKAFLGIVATDGYIDPHGRFDLYSKYEEFAIHTVHLLSGITKVEPSRREKVDKRFGVTGHRVFTKTHVYLKKLRELFYSTGRKALNPYIVNRLDEVSFAYMWMCDGYLTVGKNKKANTAQNQAFLCLEAFSREELELVIVRLAEFGIMATIKKVRWGLGYRIRFGGENLQKFISMVYPYILPCFKYKTILFYKGKDYVLDLPNAEQYVRFYTNIEDIVRHSEESETT